jgi:hypothetical protein
MNPQLERTGTAETSANQPGVFESLLASVCTEIPNQEIAEVVARLGREFKATYQPVTRREFDAVMELAVATAQFRTIDCARQLKIEEERSSATIRFDRRAVETFERDKTAWAAQPGLYLPIITGTYLGTQYIADIWNEVTAELNAGNDIPFDLAGRAVLATGSHWRVDRATGDGLNVMSWFVRIAADQSRMIDVWVQASRVREGANFARMRAKRIMAQAPGPQEARQNLANLAASESAKWSSIALELRKSHDIVRGSAGQCAVGLGTGDKTLEKELKALEKLATNALRRVERIRRDLVIQIRDRERENRRIEGQSSRKGRSVSAGHVDMRHEKPKSPAPVDKPQPQGSTERIVSQKHTAPDEPVAAGQKSAIARPDPLVRAAAVGKPEVANDRGVQKVGTQPSPNQRRIAPPNRNADNPETSAMERFVAMSLIKAGFVSG